jgi:hypothetical protein
MGNEDSADRPQPGSGDRDPALVPSFRTRYEHLTRGQALLVLAALFLVVAGCVSISFGPPPKIGRSGPADGALYTAVVQRVHAGQSYYSVLGDELHSRGYPMRSVFNWRTPLLLELIAGLPSIEWARVLLLLAAGCAIVLNIASMCRERHFGHAFGWWRSTFPWPCSG